jgi:hypothetical protein
MTCSEISPPRHALRELFSCGLQMAHLCCLHDSTVHGMCAKGIDLEVAFRTTYSWGMSDGDVGFEYWSCVAELLRSASKCRKRSHLLEEKLRCLRASNTAR